jgi:hypothetical protein
MGGAPDSVTQHLLAARLQQELRRGSSPKASESDVERDWQMLLRALNSSEEQAAERPAKLIQASSQARSERGGNRP